MEVQGRHERARGAVGPQHRTTVLLGNLYEDKSAS